MSVLRWDFDTARLQGMDHAGIAIASRKWLAEDGISLLIGGENSLEKVWEWKDEYAFDYQGTMGA